MADGGTALSCTSIDGDVVWMSSMTRRSLASFMLVVRLRVRVTNIRITTARMVRQVGDGD